MAYGVVGAGFALMLYLAHRRERSSDFVLAMLREVRGAVSLNQRFQDALVNLLVFVAITAVWPGVLFVERKRKGPIARLLADDSDDAPVFICHLDRLIERVDPRQVESAHHVHDPLGRVPDVPFGHLHAAWRNFLGQVRADDEVWSFHIPNYSRLGALPSGRMSGYVIVRDGRIAAEFAFEGC